MSMTSPFPDSWFPYLLAPLVDQSDLPFRLLCRKYGATLCWTQMHVANHLLYDRDYQEYQLKQMGEPSFDRPLIAQIAGNRPDDMVAAAKVLSPYCDAIDINLGCPQRSAKSHCHGAYLLPRQHWPLLEDIVGRLDASLTVPVTVKMRLCDQEEWTPVLADKLVQAGAKMVSLHARFTSIRRCRKGAAMLDWVKTLRETLPPEIRVVSNGNVKNIDDVHANYAFTKADGVMVGETILGNPCLFAGLDPDPIQISLEYIDLCYAYPGTAKVASVIQHLKYIFEFYWSRKYYFKTFTAALRQCPTIESIERLLRDDLREKFATSRRPENEEVEGAAVSGIKGEDDILTTMEALAIQKENQQENLRDTEDSIISKKETVHRPALGVL